MQCIHACRSSSQKKNLTEKIEEQEETNHEYASSFFVDKDFINFVDTPQRRKMIEEKQYIDSIYSDNIEHNIIRNVSVRKMDIIRMSFRINQRVVFK